MDFLDKVKEQQNQEQEEKLSQNGELDEIIKNIIDEQIAKTKAVDFYNIAKQKLAELELEKQALKSSSEELKETTIEFKEDIETLIKKLIEDTDKKSKELTKKLIDSNTMLIEQIEKKKLFENLEKNINNSLKSYTSNIEEKTSNKIEELETKIDEYKKATSFLTKVLGGTVIGLILVIIYFIFSNRAFKNETRESIKKIERVTKENGNLTKGIHDILNKDKAYWYDKDNNTIFFKEKEKKKQEKKNK